MKDDDMRSPPTIDDVIGSPAIIDDVIGSEFSLFSCMKSSGAMFSGDCGDTEAVDASCTCLATPSKSTNIPEDESVISGGDSGALDDPVETGSNSYFESV